MNVSNQEKPSFTLSTEQQLGLINYNQLVTKSSYLVSFINTINSDPSFNLQERLVMVIECPLIHQLRDQYRQQMTAMLSLFSNIPDLFATLNHFFEKLETSYKQLFPTTNQDMIEPAAKTNALASSNLFEKTFTLLDNLDGALRLCRQKQWHQGEYLIRSLFTHLVRCKTPVLQEELRRAVELEEE